MEIKFRKKGKVVTVDGFPPESIPEAINPPEGFEGIDLTAYPVIYAVFGRHGDEKAEELHRRANGAILAYKFSWVNGWGEGILLPKRFQPNRLRFYKSAAQLKVETEEKIKRAAEALYDEVVKTIPGVRVSLGHSGGVKISPDQETYSDWAVTARTLEEAKAAVEKRRRLWKEWNDRALDAFRRHNPGCEKPERGIQIYPSPTHSTKVGVKCIFVTDPSVKRRWVIFEKKGDGWLETGIDSSAPPY